MSRKHQKPKQQSEQQIDSQREFRCKCSKVYKSYPALYTHIKNKHFDRIEQFKNESKRPRQGQIDKGRPKKHRERPRQADQQGDLLNIIELGVLSIDQSLKNHVQLKDEDKKSFVLQGNASLQYEDLKENYNQQKRSVITKIEEQLVDFQQSYLISELQLRKLQDLKQEEPVKIYREQIQFKNELIQHFDGMTAAKILIQLQLIQIQEINAQIQQMNKNNDILPVDNLRLIKQGQRSLWGTNSRVILTIRQIYSKWNTKLNELKKEGNINEAISDQSLNRDHKQIEERESQSDGEDQLGDFHECLNYQN